MMRPLPATERERYVRAYLRIVDDEERMRREAIAAFELEQERRAARRRLVATLVILFAPLLAIVIGSLIF